MSGIKNLGKWPRRIGGALCQAGRPVPNRSIEQHGAYYYQYPAKCPRQNRLASPGRGRSNADRNFRDRTGRLGGWLEHWRVAPLRDAQDKRLVAPLLIEVLVKLQAQLASVHANRAIFQGAVT